MMQLVFTHQRTNSMGIVNALRVFPVKNLRLSVVVNVEIIDTLFVSLKPV
jgi:hypothetical protein